MVERVIWDQQLGRVHLLKVLLKRKCLNGKKNLSISLHRNDTTTQRTPFTHGMKSKWIYLARTTPNIEHLLAPLEEVIRDKFLAVITGQSTFDDNLRNLMARLPARLGGLGLVDPSQQGSLHYENSVSITRPLVKEILDQARESSPDIIKAQMKVKSYLRNSKRQQERADASQIIDKLSPDLQRLMEISSGKGASTWLTTLPLSDHGFTLHKGAFRDALCLRYGWLPQQLSSRCICDPH